MKLHVSDSPHIRDRASTTRFMLDVILALLPALGFAVYLYGLRSLLIVAITVSASVVFESLCRKIMRRSQSIQDLSAVVTGLLLALTFPPTVALWIPVFGAFVAIVIVKQLFGGLGQNFINPALTARVVIALSFPSSLDAWAVQARRGSQAGLPISGGGSQLVTAATPLSSLQEAGDTVAAGFPDLQQLFFGFHAGSLGEVSILALSLGALYLLLRRVITLWTPLSMMATTLLIVAISGQDPLYHLLSGALFFAAFFMATDPVTAPMTRSGKIIFGIGCGLITALIRLFSGAPEGVAYAILFMNVLTPHVERLTIPVPFGGRHREKG